MDTPYLFHHMGVPTDEKRYSEHFKMYTSDHAGEFRIQFHRFEPDSPLHPMIKTKPHVALQVANLEEAVKGKTLLLGPYEPIPRYKVAIINDGGMPVELIETDLTMDELWTRSNQQIDLQVNELNEF
jgi:hypothetical protein